MDNPCINSLQNVCALSFVHRVKSIVMAECASVANDAGSWKTFRTPKQIVMYAEVLQQLALLPAMRYKQFL